MPSAVADPWWAPYGRYGHVLVLHLELGADEYREREALAWLDDAERSRRDGYKYPGPRRRFGLCRAALRAILAARLGCRGDEIAFATSDRGKPFALLRDRPAPVSFNVSHSGGHGLVALAAGGRVGVDVEERLPRRDLDGLARAVLGPEERSGFELLASDRRLDAFFRFWTIKEAIIKGIGTGHALDVSRIQIPVAMRRGARRGEFRSPESDRSWWQLEDIGNESFAAALAYEISPRESS